MHRMDTATVRWCDFRGLMRVFFLVILETLVVVVFIKDFVPQIDKAFIAVRWSDVLGLMNSFFLVVLVTLRVIVGVIKDYVPEMDKTGHVAVSSKTAITLNC